MVAVRLGIAVEPGWVRAVAVRRGRPIWVAKAPWSSMEDLTSALASLAAERPPNARHATATLGGRLVQFKSIASPPSLSLSELREHVALAASRYFLGVSGELVTNASSVGDSAPIVAADRALIEAICAGAGSAGVILTEIVPGPIAMGRILRGASTGLVEPEHELALGAALVQRSELSLLPNDRRAVLRSDRRRSIAAFVVAAVFAFLAVLPVRMAYLALSSSSAENELASMGSAIERAAAVRRDLDAAVDALTELESAARNRSAVLSLLAGIALALPDSSFATAVRLTADGSGLVTGFAQDGAAIPAAFERIQGVLAPTLDGGLAPENVGGSRWDRFGVRFRFSGRERVP